MTLRPAGEDTAADQRAHWESTYAAHPRMYGDEPSEPARYAMDLFARHGVRAVCELGAGQGRDTQAFLRAGLRVHALDFAADGIHAIQAAAVASGVVDRLTATVQDVRLPLPLPTASVDAVYSHMLLSMAFTTTELDRIVGEVRRVLRPGGWHVYTVRHVGDAHFGTGIAHGDNRFEHGGFVVRYFNRELVDRLMGDMRLVDLAELAEGALPRRLWRVSSRVPHPGGGRAPE